MTEKEKKLLITDLSARVLYGVIISPADSSNAVLIGCLTDGVLLRDVRTGKKYEKPWELEYIKPYLRPLSSMTEEEKKEFHHVASLQRNYIGDDIFYTHWQMYDWLNSHHFDYRGLIEKGLAIEAPKEMYE